MNNKKETVQNERFLNDSNNHKPLELLEKRYFTDQLSVHSNIIKDQVNERSICIRLMKANTSIF